MRIKLLLLCLITVLLVSPLSAFAIGSDGIDVVEIINANRIIRGENADYSMAIPASWQKYVTVVRERPINGSDFAEKLIVYYKPMNPPPKQSFFLNIIIYEKAKWNNQEGYRRITQSDKYVAAASVASLNPFAAGEDKIIFDNLTAKAADDYFLKSLISLDGVQDVTNTVFVNGRALEGPVYAGDNDVVYVPLREVCTALGYTVSWSEKEQMVTIYSNSFFNQLLYDRQINKKYPLVNVNGKSYVSLSYFWLELKCLLEIDEKNNVKIKN